MQPDVSKKFVTKEALARIGVPVDFKEPLLFVFKMVSDNGANIKAAWNNGDRWVPCVDHTLELCTLPVTWVQKHKNQANTLPKGSVAEAYAHGRGIVGYLHVSVNALDDFHTAQRACDLEETQIDLDCKTRWRTAYMMGEQLVYNKGAILEMDKNPTYKVAGETWGNNKISMRMWDFLEEGTAVLDDAAWASQFLEGDKYPTSSLVIPMMFRLMLTSSMRHDIKFLNRKEDEHNDDTLNPVTVRHDKLTDKMQAARKALHNQFVERFDTDVPIDCKKFWFISTMCDPRFKKLTFLHDGMMTDVMRANAVKWFTAEFNRNYKNKFNNSTEAAAGDGGGEATRPRHLKRRKTSAAGFFAGSDDEDADKEEAVVDELEAYLAVPQIKYKTEKDTMLWWQEFEPKFPNVAIMARQYLGCPASSATVERLFSTVGIAFSAKRKSAEAATVADIMFAHANLP